MVHRAGDRGRIHWRAGAWWHGLRRGRRRGAILRDARITTIYEGTTGIQANDLIGRKIAFEKGATANRLSSRACALSVRRCKSLGADFEHTRSQLSNALDAMDAATSLARRHLSARSNRGRCGGGALSQALRYGAGRRASVPGARSSPGEDGTSLDSDRDFLVSQARDGALLRRACPAAGRTLTSKRCCTVPNSVLALEDTQF